MEFTLLWAVLTAAAFGWMGLRIWPARVPDHAFDRLVMAAVVGLAAGRVSAMIAQGVNPITSIGDFIVVRGGVDTAAASIAFLTTLAWTSRGSLEDLDAIAPATLLALAGWHAGCLWRGACLGTVSDLPWAWALEGGTVTRHPVELYAAIGLAAGAWLVSRLGWRALLRAGSGLSIAAAVRLLTEPLRPSITGGPVWWYVAGVAVGLLAVAAGPRLIRSVTRTPT
jgi:hypothetical protein